MLCCSIAFKIISFYFLTCPRAVPGLVSVVSSALVAVDAVIVLTAALAQINHLTARLAHRSAVLAQNAAAFVARHTSLAVITKQSFAGQALGPVALGTRLAQLAPTGARLHVIGAAVAASQHLAAVALRLLAVLAEERVAALAAVRLVQCISARHARAQPLHLPSDTCWRLETLAALKLTHIIIRRLAFANPAGNLGIEARGARLGCRVRPCHSGSSCRSLRGSGLAC